MSAGKNMSVCVATSPRLLIKVDANCAAQEATSLPNPAAQASYVRRRSAGMIVCDQDEVAMTVGADR